MHLRHLTHEGHHVAEEFHQSANTHRTTAADAEHGEDGACDESLADTLAHLILGERLLLEELLHQVLVVLGSSLHECLMQFQRLFLLLLGNILDDGRTALGLPRIFLHQQHVDECVEVGTGIQRILHGHALRTVDFLHLREYGVEVARVAVKLVDKEDNRFFKFICVSENILRTNLRTILAVDEHQRLVGHVECRDGSAHEIVGTRAVDDIKFLVVPLYVENSREYRVAIFLLDWKIVAHRVLGFHRATTLDDATFEQHTFGKSSLAATRTAKQGNVLNFVGLIYFHIFKVL